MAVKPEERSQLVALRLRVQAERVRARHKRDYSEVTLFHCDRRCASTSLRLPLRRPPRWLITYIFLQDQGRVFIVQTHLRYTYSARQFNPRVIPHFVSPHPNPSHQQAGYPSSWRPYRTPGDNDNGDEEKEGEYIN